MRLGMNINIANKVLHEDNYSRQMRCLLNNHEMNQDT